jgi:hypothetical protein
MNSFFILRAEAPISGSSDVHVGFPCSSVLLFFCRIVGHSSHMAMSPTWTPSMALALETTLVEWDEFVVLSVL